MLQWTLRYMCLFELLSSQGICPVVGFLSHMVVLCGTYIQWNIQFISVQLRSPVQLFLTPRTAVHQAALSITKSWSLNKLMSIDQWCHPAISSSWAPFSRCPRSFAASGSFPMSRLFASGCQSTGASASASVLPEYSGLISFRIVWFDLLSVQGTLKCLL